MLLDTLTHGALYPFGLLWARVFDELPALAARGADLPDGVYPLAGGQEHGGVTATVNTCSLGTENAARYESHDVMADIQVVLAGAEDIRVVGREALTAEGTYDSVRDVAFYRATPVSAARLSLVPGLFAFFLPQDAHMPGLEPIAGSAAPVTKLVVKIPVRMLTLA